MAAKRYHRGRNSALPSPEPGILGSPGRNVAPAGYRLEQLGDLWGLCHRFLVLGALLPSHSELASTRPNKVHLTLHPPNRSRMVVTFKERNASK